MHRLIITLSTVVALAGCAAGRPGPAPQVPVFTLSAPGFQSGDRLQQRHAGNASGNPNCVGQNISPALSWANVPEGTRSMAFIVYDQDGRSGLGVVHWVGYNVATSTGAFQENEISAPSAKYTGGKSTLNLPIYMGPCPPAHTGHHHYVFTAIATDLEPGALPPGLTMAELLARLQGHAKGSSSTVLRYGRP